MVKLEIRGTLGSDAKSKVEVMHVFMKDGNQRRWLTDVFLKDGFCPYIGDQANKVFTNVAPMEPAIWCKVLVLDSISIDCNERIIRWSTGCNIDDDNSPQNQYCINEECSGYDTEDELFDLARIIIDRSRHDLAEDDAKMSILRMLHCFVLPKVSFHKSDIAKVEQAKEEQVKNIKALDVKLKDKCYEVTDSQEELGAKHEQFLPDIEELIDNNHCDKPFLDLLLDDLKHEEQRIRVQIDKAQDVVENAKVLPPEKRSSAGLLYQAKEQRDSLTNKLVLLLTAREEIMEGMKYLKEGEPKKPIKVLREYVEQRGRCQKLKEERLELTQQKNCALSVREKLDEILNDLKTQGFSEADDADSKGHRSTDVLQNVWYPEWQKLSERVATIVYNIEHPVGNSFDKFCDEVHGMCQDLIRLGRLNSPEDGWSGADIAINDIPSEDRLGENSYGLNDFVVESYRDRLKQLRGTIFKHLDQMTGLLCDLFNNHDAPFRNKLRLAYEHCFYEREHVFIECVYELAHHEHIASLETDIKRLKKLPIKLLKLPMKDEWWHEIFQQRIQICELNAQVFKPLADSISSLENISVHAEINGETNVVIDEEINGERDDSSDSQNESIEDDLDGLDEDFPFPIKRENQYLDSMSVRSFFISTIRTRSRTFNHGLSPNASDDEDGDPANEQRTEAHGSQLSSSAPTSSKLSLGKLIDKWQERDEPERKTFERKPSKSYHELSKTNQPEPSCTLQKNDTFEDHFGPALQHMKDMFNAISPVAKLKCLTASLRKIAAKVSELRMRDGKDSFSSAVTAEDLLPLLILMMLQMEPCDAASMWPQLAMLEDLMAPCLSSGCHGWALVEFQMAQRILADLCSQF